MKILCGLTIEHNSTRKEFEKTLWVHATYQPIEFNIEGPQV